MDINQKLARTFIWAGDKQSKSLVNDTDRLLPRLTINAGDVNECATSTENPFHVIQQSGTLQQLVFDFVCNWNADFQL
jgi:hypothetical protein